MSNVGDNERKTQNHLVKLFQEQLGYKYYGNWEDRESNSNIEEKYVTEYLTSKGYTSTQISKVLYKLNTTAFNYNESLYTNNKNVYQLLRYGVKVQADASENYETVHLFDWNNPLNNNFAIAEEVTIQGNREKRPDIVIYVNGIALGVVELKRSTVTVGDGIRQSIVNQQKEFIQSFFSSIQYVFAGNDTEGLRYGTIGTGEKYFLKWKEDSDVENILDRYVLKMCDKSRFLEIIYDFVLFDGGVKKLCRPHQYFGIKATQEQIRRREGGILWHTQGSGKSILMVLLAKWILENKSDARIAIITDRDELDKQIERVFNDAGEEIKRTSSGRDLISQLGQAKPRLLCSLVHKFGKKGVENFDAFIEELKNQPSPAVGELYIFVDECHRTQSGKLHKVMKALLPNALFIGFTGTPLLKTDKQTSLEVFGKYIHTYKFNEAVEDEVVLDLIYEARDIDQRIASQERVDEWFERKSKTLNDFQKAELKKHWGTMQQVLSSKSRLNEIVKDVIFDFSIKPRLSSEHGNAILVASSIFDAVRYFDLFQGTFLRGRCAVITSYNPSTKDITTEDTGANTDTDKEFIYKTYVALLGDKTTEKYEDAAKEKFIKEPANMKLLIVVDKLLTGFDAPSCSYLYIDKSMKDHGLFQAICRVNRLDGEDKQFGYIVDYQDLFKRVENAVAVYTSELDYDNFEKKDCDILLKDRLKSAKERLDNSIEAIKLLCENVTNPKTKEAYIRYFCGNPENPDDLKASEVKRITLYKSTVALIRAYANIANEIIEAGYTEFEAEEIKKTLDFYLTLREEIRMASGEVLDLKTYEADMRFLIDNYIEAKTPDKISTFGDLTLIDIIVKTGIADAINSLPKGIQGSRQAVSETIENNVRSKIIKDHLIDPAFFEEMSKLLNAIIKERKDNAIDYAEYLKEIARIAELVSKGATPDTPDKIRTPAQKALYNNLGKDPDLAIRIDDAIREVKKADWRGNLAKENEIKRALYDILQNVDEVERIFIIVKNQSEY